MLTGQKVYEIAELEESAMKVSEMRWIAPENGERKRDSMA
jgi:hypothetical protein